MENVREGENENIDNDTRGRARKFVDAGGSSTRVFADPDRFSGAKPKVVTKEELAKSGLSLRDYMNKQQGLTRRGGAAPSSSSSVSAGGRGPTAEEFAAAATPSKRARLESALDRGVANPKGYADPEFSPQAGGIATGALKGLSAAARGLMGRAAKPAERVDPEFASQASGAAVKALAAPVKRIGFDKAGAKAAERGARAEGRQAEMLKENARRSGLREDAPAETAKAVREKLGGKDFSLPMKKGGAVKKYASGGSVSSRADGIAQRGKTRGRMC
jgi:hypothetical protein